MSRRWKIFTAVSVAVLVIDQLTKWWARTSLPTNASGWGTPVTVIENFFHWRLSYNNGSAFGLFDDVNGARIFLTVVGIGAVIGILFLVKHARDDQRRLAAAFGLVAGGAVGNVIDRVIAGRVTDFILWHYYQHEWPVFNIADAALCVGVALLFLDLGKEKGKEKAADEKAPGAKTKKRHAQ
ncbi:MAG TPA: signal peptidase II [Kofleriaceae bacterium]|nr:signal peptidase II [Kofleriaceae bacterium]